MSNQEREGTVYAFATLGARTERGGVLHEGRATPHRTHGPQPVALYVGHREA